MNAWLYIWLSLDHWLSEIIMPRVEKLTLVIVGIALVALAVGYLLTEMGVSVTPTIPFYAPFLSVFNIVFLIAGFILIVFDNELDEFILALKMKTLPSEAMA